MALRPGHDAVAKVALRHVLALWHVLALRHVLALITTVGAMAHNMQDWLADFAAEVGITPPTREELDILLELAGVAARASERPAAPLTCWLAGRAGVEPRDALAIGKRLAGDSETDGG